MLYLLGLQFKGSGTSLQRGKVLIDMNRKKILMIDDARLNLATAREVLKEDYALYEATSAKQGFEIMEEVLPDLILLDIIMPEMDGYEMITQLKSNRRLKSIPVIFLTAVADPVSEVKGFNLGAVDFITKPFVAPVMKRRIATQLQLYSYQNELAEIVEQKVEEVEKMQHMLASGFAELVESRDGVTGGHIKNTLIYYEAFVEVLQHVPQYKDEVTPEFVKLSVRAAPLHDIGKIGIDDNVLRKQSGLERSEMQYMQTHAENMALYHHERWDGNGYPVGLSGTEIPIEARIMSVVDVYDALTSQRPYKKPFTHERSMEIIREGKGTQFDPDLVDQFVKAGELIRDRLKHKEEIRKQML